MKRRSKGWHGTSLSADIWLTAFVTVLLVVWVYCFDGADRVNQVFDGVRVSVYRSTIVVAASLLGFSLTVISVVVGFSSHKRLKLLRESRHYPTVWRTFFGAVHALGLLLLCAFLGLVLDRDQSPVVALEVAYVALCILAALRLHRSVRILRQLVDVIAKPVKERHR